MTFEEFFRKFSEEQFFGARPAFAAEIKPFLERTWEAAMREADRQDDPVAAWNRANPVVENPEPGDWVRYAYRDNGYDIDRATAAADLDLGTVYEVSDVWREPFETRIRLKGRPGRYNSILFAPVRRT